MSDKTFHQYKVIDSGGDSHTLIATSYKWEFEPGVGRILKLKPQIYNESPQGEFTNPRGIYLEERAPEWAQPDEEDNEEE